MSFSWARHEMSCYQILMLLGSMQYSLTSDLTARRLNGYLQQLSARWGGEEWGGEDDEDDFGVIFEK